MLNPIRVKDFIETAEGLLFAVVAPLDSAGVIPCFLRYAYLHGKWQKMATVAANGLLAAQHPNYLYYSERMDAHLHGVYPAAVVRHYHAQAQLQTLMASPAVDPVITDCQNLCRLLTEQGIAITELGITGSLLLGLQNSNSDIDLLCYERSLFKRLRETVKQLIATNDCQALDLADWQESYQRRACDLSLAEYIWHEQRKFNKAIINQRKFDLSLVTATALLDNQRYQKLGAIEIITQISDDSFSYDYPATWNLVHPEIDQLVCFTATYTGQACRGETILISGQLEVDQQGRKRILVGSNREANGEFIKVMHD